MRFRAKMHNSANILQLTKVVTTISRSARQCVLRLSEDKVSFASLESGVLGGVNLWCELSQADYFDEYRIEGRDERNEIYLEVPLDQMVRAFRSAHSAQVLKMKLGRKEGALLCFEILQPTSSSTQRHLAIDIPVTMVPPRLWEDYQEPKMPDIDVSIYLPSLRSLKTNVDRMKNLALQLFISADMCGNLTLRVETETVAVNVLYSNLRNHLFGGDEDGSQGGAEAACEACVDIKRFSQVLASQFVPLKAICNIVHEKAVQVFLLHEDICLMYFFPSVRR